MEWKCRCKDCDISQLKNNLTLHSTKWLLDQPGPPPLYSAKNPSPCKAYIISDFIAKFFHKGQGHHSYIPSSLSLNKAAVRNSIMPNPLSTSNCKLLMA